MARLSAGGSFGCRTQITAQGRPEHKTERDLSSARAEARPPLLVAARQIDGGKRRERAVVGFQVAADVLEMAASIVVHEVGVAVVLDADPQSVGQVLASELLRSHDSIKQIGSAS